MEKFSEKEAIRIYLRLMHELTIRIELVAYACDGKLNLTPPYAREYAYLQFRRICELIALGCLQLHGDLPEARTKAVKKEWNAEKILRLLHRNHPHSFPQSVTQTKKMVSDIYMLTQSRMHSPSVSSRRYATNAEKFCIEAP